MPKPDYAAERAAAEWVLNRGDEVCVRRDDQEKRIRRLAELPPQPFVVTQINLLKVIPISAEGIQRLSKLTQLEDVRILGVPNTGDLLKALPDSPSCTFFSPPRSHSRKGWLSHCSGIRGYGPCTFMTRD